MSPVGKRILIVEDELDLIQVLRDYLERAGFQVEAQTNGSAAIASVKQSAPDLILLDLNLPGVDGLDVARQIRRFSEVPIIMVTARVEEADKLIGLELGADDYITKPFSPREVVARVRAVLRRSHAAPIQPETLQVGDVLVDLARHQVEIHGEAVALTPTEFDLLAVMVAQPGRAFTRMQLLEATQGEAYEGYERTIDAHIKNLRSKIEPDPRNPGLIETVFGVGYRFRGN
ncbi:MAG: response regulator [Anaerolineales bacterium]|jgi:two-component system alkaline phosphatase synthesis response regulator PhoP